MKLALTGALVASVLFASSASAAVTVNTVSDSNASGGCVGAPGDCSLRQAIGVAGPGETVFVPAGTYGLTLGSLSVTQGVRIEGAGARPTLVAVEGGSAPHAFVVGSPDRVTISGMTISARAVDGEGTELLHGGAVYNETGSKLSLDAVAVSGTILEKRDKSSGAVRGAGIANNGTLDITNSTVGPNVQLAVGNESGDQGAGLFNSGGTVSLTNSTIAANSQVAGEGADASGSGIANVGGGTVTMLNVSITANVGSAAIGGSGTTEIRNSILANAFGNCEAAIISLGSNLESTDQCGLHAAGDRVGIDPMIGGPTANGGETDTAAPQPGSPAIDHGDTAACPPTDQRGVARPQGPACDIGAVELVPSIATPSNAFKFGKLKRNKAKGTAVLSVTVPGPGTIALAGKGIVAKPAKPIAAAGVVKLQIKAKGKARRKLGRVGKAKVTAKVTYTPTGGAANTQAKTAKLIKRG